jgi:hypothetical protein
VVIITVSIVANLDVVELLMDGDTGIEVSLIRGSCENVNELIRAFSIVVAGSNRHCL